MCVAGVTVHQLGEVYRGPDSFIIGYWSPEDSPYRHAYPVSNTAGSSPRVLVLDIVTEGAGSCICASWAI